MGANIKTISEHQLSIIVSALKIANGNKVWRLHEPVTVKLSPHTQPLYIDAIVITVKDKLMVMNYELINQRQEEQWNEVEAFEPNADKVIASIYQRVMATYKTANIL